MVMLPQSEGRDSSGDINHVLEELGEPETTLRNSFGKMVQKETGPRVGAMMSFIGKWLMEERSYAITGSAILFSVVALAFFVGVMFEHARSLSKGKLYFTDKTYQIIGIAGTTMNGKIVYFPIYEEEK